MQLTRIDSTKLKAALAKAEKKVDEALAEVTAYTVLLTDEVRAKTPRARDGFETAGRKLALEIKARPNLVNATQGFSSEAVVEDLDNVALLDPLATKVGKLSQRLGDSKLTWTGEAWEPSLELYGIAKLAAKKDPELKKIIEPMAQIFAKTTAKMTKAEKAVANAAKRQAKKIAKAKQLIEKQGK